jgi:hypothetical protein
LLAEGNSIESAHNIDLVVARIIHCGREITTSGIWHGRTRRPAVGCNVVDLSGIQDKEVRVESAEDIDLVIIRVVSDPSVIEAGWHIRQRGPNIRRQIIPVKSILRQAVTDAAC